MAIASEPLRKLGAELRCSLLLLRRDARLNDGLVDDCCKSEGKATHDTTANTFDPLGDTLQLSCGLPEGDNRGLGLKESCEKRSEGEAGYFIEPIEF